MAVSSGAFPMLLRELRARGRLTQGELAAAAGVSLRTVSDLERGVAATPQRETTRLLADALSLTGPERLRFEVVARGGPLDNPAQAAAMRSLPRDVASFTGRGLELDELLKSARTTGGLVSIHAIGGMAGVGKTAFAVHAAYQLADRFPGGQVFLSLHGHTPGQRPVEPADALASLLLAIGVPAGQVPPGQEARSALWRDRVRDKRLLLLLDDAASSEQVLPLLPGDGGSLVLVTSRRHLSALDDATAISLDTLRPPEAAALLLRLAGRPGLGASEPAVAELVQLCGYLPLAIGMMARQLRHHPRWTVAGRVAELAAARDRLELMETERLSVAAAFDLSYVNLSDGQQRLFRRMGLHPGADVDGYAAAALDGTGLAAARRGLAALYDQYLVTEPVEGRFRMHDLIREHARALAARLDPAEERDLATGRLLDYYEYAGAVATARIRGRKRPGPDRAGAGAEPGAVPPLDDQDQALAWIRAERTGLLGCLDQVTAAGQPDRVVALTAAAASLLQHDGPWAEAIARQEAATRAARRLGDRYGEANALIDLGAVRVMTSDYPATARDLQEALALYRGLDDRMGQADALHHLADVRYFTGDFAASVQAHQETLSIYRELGDRMAQARDLSGLGEVWQLMGDFPAATRALADALEIYRDLGGRIGQGRALCGLGEVSYLTGDFPAATRALEEALEIYDELGSRRGQARALSGLGTVRQLSGDYPAAVRTQEQAVTICRELGNRTGQASALTSLGTALRLAGDLSAAGGALDEALGIFHDLRDRGGTAAALNERGALHLVCAEPEQARQCHQQSLELSRAIDSSRDEAYALAGLGRGALAAGQRDQAAGYLRQALEIFERIGAIEVRDLRAELAALAG